MNPATLPLDLVVGVGQLGLLLGIFLRLGRILARIDVHEARIVKLEGVPAE